MSRTDIERFVACCFTVFLISDCSFCVSAAAAVTKLQFNESYCSHTIIFDPMKYDKAVVNDSGGLVYSYDEDHNGYGDEPRINTAKERAGADLDRYADKCDQEVKRLEGLRLLDVPGLEDLRQEQRAAVIDRCHLVSAEVRGAKGDLDALATYVPARPSCSHFIDELRRSQLDFASVWRPFAATRCRVQHDTKKCEKEYLERARKPSAFPDLRIEVLQLGWYNCANGVSYINKGSDGDPMMQGDIVRRRAAVDKALSRALKVVAACERVD